LAATLVVIYGPPAAGKLTVASELAELTGFKLFHNHLTMNAVREVFDFGTIQLAETLARVRLVVFEAAAREGVDMIFTLANQRRRTEERPGFVDRFIADIDRIVEGSGGRVVRAQLCPPPEVLLDRVTEASRFTHNKLTDVEWYRGLFQTHELYDTLGDDDLAIDNSDLAPADVARTIRDHHGL
jgi:hypothetical protein